MKDNVIDMLHRHMLRKAEVFYICGGCRAFYLKNTDVFDPGTAPRADADPG